jgi:hypothetical protein
MSQYFFILDSRDFILDPRTRKVVAIIRNGEVFRDDDGAKIAVFVGSSLYDLNGNFLGTLDGCTRSLPIALGKLLEGSSAADSPYPLSFPRRARRLPLASRSITSLWLSPGPRRVRSLLRICGSSQISRLPFSSLASALDSSGSLPKIKSWVRL